MKNRKGQTGGLITGLVFGVAGLIIGVIIAFIIVSTLTDSDLMSGTRGSSTVTEEAGWLNNTGYTLATYDLTVAKNFEITAIANVSHDIYATSGNWTFVDGVLTNASAEPSYSFDAINVSYTYDAFSLEEISSNRMDTNFTRGVDNVSAKIPTVLLVAAIVLILSVLAILVGVWQRMSIGGGSTL